MIVEVSKPVIAVLGFVMGVIIVYLILGDQTGNSARSTEISKGQTLTHQSIVPSEDIEELRRALKALAKGANTRDRRIDAMDSKLNTLRSRATHYDGLEAAIPLYAAESEEWITQDGESMDGLTQSSANDQKVLIEETINVEELDSVWANFAVRELEAVFQDEEGQGFEVLDTHCRSTLCRITLQPDDSKTGNEIVNNLGRLIPLLPWNSGAWFSINDNGEVVGYLAREGYLLPESGISQAF